MNLVKRNSAINSAWPMLFDNFFNRDAFKEGNLNFYDDRTSIPAVNIKDNPKAYALEMIAPGMEKTDFKIELENDVLTITAEKSTQNSDADEGVYSRKEFSYQSLRRSFTFPQDIVDKDRIEAKYKDGILYITIPKRENTTNNTIRQIEIS
ncbi:Hsp20/alpha crystallin family protein [Flavobacterium aquiphilum]|uniref:Hsp20/alpha crystallin family protein n=1 Tax=Flavobacterium aquiphilum TaxID=3003261 RepID=UPI0024816564|nr:Hsp20/alpha crystallin family protein [Flavobacterium aquiphilum]